MLMNPDVQIEAHRELDKVLAPGDLPTFALESDLPYISAIVREVLRYQPPWLLVEYRYTYNVFAQVSTGCACRLSTSQYRRGCLQRILDS
jgi:cytochrome P450